MNPGDCGGIAAAASKRRARPASPGRITAVRPANLTKNSGTLQESFRPAPHTIPVTPVTLSFHALWMLCALGAVVFAAAAARPVREQAFLAAGFGAGALLASPERLPDPALAGTLAAAAAAVYLFRPGYAMLAAGFGGALGGMWTALLEVQGLPLPVALAAGAVALVVPSHLARTRATFAPELLRDEGLLAIAVLGLAVAILPAILDGWQAAGTLSATSERPSAAALPVWTLTIILMSASLGGLYSFWSRR